MYHFEWRFKFAFCRCQKIIDHCLVGLHTLFCQRYEKVRQIMKNLSKETLEQLTENQRKIRVCIQSMVQIARPVVETAKEAKESVDSKKVPDIIGLAANTGNNSQNATSSAPKTSAIYFHFIFI